MSSQKKLEVAKSELRCEFFTYAVDDLEIGGFYAAPKATQVPRGVLIFNRGGNRTYGNVDMALMSHFIFPLAAQGFFVIGSQYRGGLGDQVSSPGKDEYGGRDVDDVLALLSIIDSIPAIAGKKVGLYGGSRGGIMAFRMAVETDRVGAIALSAPVTDMVRGLAFRPRMEKTHEQLIPDYDKRKIAALQERSVVYWADKIDANIPILLMHGQWDERVDAASTLRLAAQFQEAMRPYKLIIYERDGHFFNHNHHNVVSEYTSWFKKYL